AALRAVAIAGEKNSMTADAAAAHARAVGHRSAATAGSVLAAVRELTAVLAQPSRILICGSLYLAGRVLAENG
ncbi:MAG: bifunctional folylpolyglutamate synthase/dihydrofolate synthase, partial [Alphaproteobacteria bacterium]